MKQQPKENEPLKESDKVQVVLISCEADFMLKLGTIDFHMKGIVVWQESGQLTGLAVELESGVTYWVQEDGWVTGGKPLFKVEKL